MRWVKAIITLKVKHLAFGSGYLATRYGERISLTKTKNDANSGPGKADDVRPLATTGDPEAREFPGIEPI